MRYAAKTDANQQAISEALEALGWGVKSMAGVGQGFPDLIALKAGRTIFVEVKNPARSGKRKKPNALQQELHAWFARYGVTVLTVTRLEDLAQVDAQARQVYEGHAPRNYYPE